MRYTVKQRKSLINPQDPINIYSLPKKVAYARVSTLNQADAHTALEQQKARLSKHADYVLTDIESGRKDRDSRYAFNLLWEAVEEGIVKEVVCTRIDRLFRQGLISHAFLQHLIDNQCKLTALDCDVDFTSPSGQMMFGVLSAQAAFFSNDLSERIKHGRRYSREKGKTHMASFGYYLQDGYLVINKAPYLSLLKNQKTYSEYDIACAIVDHYLTGEKGLTHTCDWIRNYFGYPFFESPNGLRAWLAGSHIVGDTYYRTENRVFPNTHEGIISRKCQQKILRKLEINNQRRGYGVSWASKKKPQYPLSGLIYCEECGYKMRIHTKRPNKDDNSDTITIAVIIALALTENVLVIKRLSHSYSKRFKIKLRRSR